MGASRTHLESAVQQFYSSDVHIVNCRTLYSSLVKRDLILQEAMKLLWLERRLWDYYLYADVYRVNNIIQDIYCSMVN